MMAMMSGLLRQQTAPDMDINIITKILLTGGPPSLVLSPPQMD